MATDGGETWIGIIISANGSSWTTTQTTIAAGQITFSSQASATPEMTSTRVIVSTTTPWLVSSRTNWGVLPTQATQTSRPSSGGGNPDITAIIAGTIVSITVVCLILGYAIWRWRKKTKTQRHLSRIPSWVGKKARSVEPSLNAIPSALEMADTAQPLPPVSTIPPLPPHSPERLTVHSPPSTPPRTTSLSPSLMDVMSEYSAPESNPYDAMSEHTLMPFDSSSQRATDNIGYRYSSQPQGAPPTILAARSRTDLDQRALDGPDIQDNTRELFLEEALRRNLPFDKLARPSLRFSGLEAQRNPAQDLGSEVNRDRHSMSPPPLRIIKRGSSDNGRVSARSSYRQSYKSQSTRGYPPVTRNTGDRGITPSQSGLRGIQEQPRRSSQAAAPEFEDWRSSENEPFPDGPEHSQIGTLDLINDDAGSDHEEFEEKRRRQLSYTQKCLEGIIPGFASENMFSRGPPRQGYSEPMDVRRNRSSNARDPGKKTIGGSEGGIDWSR
jgi:hypothetical protein